MSDTDIYTETSNGQNSDDDFIIGEENEPYLGPSWAVLMFVLYILKVLFPATPYSYFWWFQIYIVAIVFGITIFTLVKRYIYFNQNQSVEEKEEKIT